MKSKALLGAITIFSMLPYTLAFGQAAGSQSPPAPDGAKADQKKEEPKQDPKVVEYEKAIKDLKRVEGAWTLYTRKKDLLLELPESKIGKLFCLQAALNTGVMGDVLQAGFPVGNFTVDVFRFDRAEESLWLVRPALKHRWAADDPLAVASQRSFPEAILGSFRIEQTHTEKKLLLVNVTQLFYGDVLRLSEVVGILLGGAMLDRDKSSTDEIRGYPENTVVRMKLHFLAPRGAQDNPLAALLGLGGGGQLEDSRSAPLKVTYSLWFRKDSGYMPREFDPRVGYFTEDFFDVGRFAVDDRSTRYITRFALQKKSPGAALSEPVKPIVWYLDTSIPKAYRPAIREGILYWNRAFEAIGYKEAIVVREAPDNDPDFDHADGRYSVVRWAMSEDATYAIAMARADPLTGEVLNASVNMDANLLYAAFREQQRLANPGAGMHQRALALLERDDIRDAQLTPEQFLFGPEPGLRAKAVREALRKLNWTAQECRYAEGKADSAALGWNAIEATGTRMSKEEYAKAFLRDIVSHEIGHTLGLRHNFVASTRLTTAELGSDSVTARHGLTSSVMDYVPVNIMAVLGRGRNYYAPRIGEYDVWAIRYGYIDVPASKLPAEERHQLSRIASQSGRIEHRFMTDESADGFDPFVVRFDNARDPLNYSEKVLLASKNVLQYAVNELPRPGEGYAKRTQLILGAVNRAFREGMAAARFVGGVAGSRNFRGDAGEVPTLAPVDPSTQRAAVRMIVRNCFSAGAFALSSEVLSNLSQDPNDDAAAGWSAPLREMIGMQQNGLYATLMAAATTRRIAENELKWGNRGNPYTMEEHFSAILGGVFGDLGKGESVPPIRRDLQRFAINALMIQAGAGAGGVSEDVRMLASDSLRRLSTRLAGVAKRPGTANSMTRIHVRDAKESIDRFLARINVSQR